MGVGVGVGVKVEGIEAVFWSFLFSAKVGRKKWSWWGGLINIPKLGWVGFESYYYGII
jgi:hypothetical protein